MSRKQKSFVIVVLAGIALGALVGFYSFKATVPEAAETSSSAPDGHARMKAKRAVHALPRLDSEPARLQDESSVVATPTASTSDHDEPPIFMSIEKEFIFKALKRPVLDTKTEFDPKTSRYIKSTLVKDDGEWGYLLVKQSFQDEALTKVWGETVQVGNHIMVQFQDYLSPAALDSFVRDNDLSLKSKMLLKGSYVFVSDAVSIDHMAKLTSSLQNTPGIRNAEANYLMFATAIPNDPRMNQLWGFQNQGRNTKGEGGYQTGNDTRVNKAWDTLTDCSSILIGVLDTGIDYNHPDLKDNMSLELGRDFTTNNPKDFMDRHSHGTHCAGSIGAVGNNAIGVAGVCWKAKMVPIKVLGDGGGGSVEGITNAVIYAANSEIKILSMSLGGGGPNNQQAQAFAQLEEKNKLAVIATGNSNENIDQKPSFPAAYPANAILSVSAYNGRGDLAGFSNYGENGADISAPGEDIMSTIPLSKVNGNANSAYAAYSGTSMATPITAGIAALLWAAAPNMKAMDVKKELLATADKGTFSKPIAGNRKVNVEKALTVLAPKAAMINAAKGGNISLVNGDSFEFQVKNENPYTVLKSVEIFNGTESLGKADGEKIMVKLPFANGSVKLTAKVTDSMGKSFTTEIVDMSVDVTKSIDLTAIDLGPHKGEVACSLSRTNEKMERTVLYEGKVDTKAYCDKLCKIITPTAYTSKGTLACIATEPPVTEREKPKEPATPVETKG